MSARPRWLPIEADVRNLPGKREGFIYRSVLSQFDVQHNPRYAPEGSKTWCNIFVWDCTRALGCEVPHWLNTDGNPTKAGQGNETTANLLHAWLRGHGKRFGWKPCTPLDAHEAVSRGEPVVAVWRNPSGPGHIAMVLPGPSGTLHIAQAGRSCLWDVPLAAGFGKHEPQLYTHK